MKRRVISLLAIFAMLCTMIVFAMPTTAAATEYPCFKDYATVNNFADVKDWAISSPEDWLAMITYVDSSVAGDATYFDGVTFHLTQNINFNGNKSNAMQQLGAAVKDENDVYHPKYFSGTINGHGYGFENVFLYTTTGTTTGLINQLGNCSFIDFGVSSGEINRNGGNGSTSVSTFGALTADHTVNFTRVWSGAAIRSLSQGHASALVGAPAGAVEANINVNGYIFDGLVASDGVSSVDTDGDGVKETIEALRNVYGVVGSYADAITGTHTYKNILVDGVVSNPRQSNGNINANSNYVDYAEPAPPFGMFRFETDKPTVFENVYGIIGERDGFQKLATPYFKQEYTVRDDAHIKTDALEAAWLINSAQTAEGADAVYYTLTDDGNIRPIAEGESTEKIVKVTLTGIKYEVYYLNGDTTYNLETTFGKNDKQTFKVNGNTVTSLKLGKEDVVIEVTTDCPHTNCSYEVGENEHRRICNMGCGYDLVQPCSARSYRVDSITEAQLAKGEPATHGGICQFCGQRFTLECSVDYVLSAQASKDAYWDYSACDCGRENVVHSESAIAKIGDANGDGTVNLVDALRMLKKLASLNVKVRARNADMDGNNVVDMPDVTQVIRAWLGDVKANNLREAVERRVNTENHFDPNAVSYKSMNMDGTDGANAGFVVSEAIAVDKGNKITFGPVRLGTPVMAYFFDAEGTPLQLVNHTNINTEATLKNGMVMGSITAPEGAATMRFQLPETDMEQFYARINNAFAVLDYQERMGIDADTVANPLKNRTLLTVGDSLCAASSDTRINGLRGWARRIRDNFDANVTNSSQGGAALSTLRLESSPDKPRQYITNQLLEHTDGTDFDYILLEGGANDANVDAPLGEISLSYDPSTFNTETFAGGLEMLIYTAVRDHGNTAAIGYMSLYEMPLSAKFCDSGPYFALGEKICEKWGIAYLDLFNDFEFDTSIWTKDGVHAIAEGYDVMQPEIDAFLPKMRPVPYDVWTHVQNTLD